MGKSSFDHSVSVLIPGPMVPGLIHGWSQGIVNLFDTGNTGKVSNWEGFIRSVTISVAVVVP